MLGRGAPYRNVIVNDLILDAEGRLTATITYNKFLVFVTAEASADVERWAGPILLRGASASARMHTMAGHGPFMTESCRSWGFSSPGSRSTG